MNRIVFKRSASLLDTHFTYCPGCGHGVAHRLIAETLDELDIRERTVALWPIGCSVFGDVFFNTDSMLASHGRNPAVDTGLVRSLRLIDPDAVVFSYQGDGDLASIGMGEIVHAANRGENYTAIFINNAVYGMTSGQMAPTSLIGQKTTTTHEGRNAAQHGYPIRMCELLSTLTAPAYIARVGLFDAKHILQAKKAVKKAFETQLAGRGFSFVEMLSACPTNWKLTPEASMKWIVENMLPVFPLGEFRTPESNGSEPKEKGPREEKEGEYRYEG